MKDDALRKRDQIRYEIVITAQRNPEKLPWTQYEINTVIEATGIFNTEEFAKKYALIYTAVLAVLLIVPLIVYVVLLLQIDEAKVKLSLDGQVAYHQFYARV